jgi:hypothetical protein
VPPGGAAAYTPDGSLYNRGNFDFTIRPEWPPTLAHHRVHPFEPYDPDELNDKLVN